jgi:hypothetical protein
MDIFEAAQEWRERQADADAAKQQLKVVIKAHLEIGVSQARAARDAGVGVLTIRAWMSK